MLIQLCLAKERVRVGGGWVKCCEGLDFVWSILTTASVNLLPYSKNASERRFRLVDVVLLSTELLYLKWYVGDLKSSPTMHCPGIRNNLGYHVLVWSTLLKMLWSLLFLTTVLMPEPRTSIRFSSSDRGHSMLLNALTWHGLVWFS